MVPVFYHFTQCCLPPVTVHTGHLTRDVRTSVIVDSYEAGSGGSICSFDGYGQAVFRGVHTTSHAHS